MPETIGQAVARFSTHIEWSHEADIICVGFGGAGAVAAITAADLGCRVIILEKQPADLPNEIRHTPSSRMNGGIFICPTEVAKAADYLYACSWGATPRDVCEVWARYTAENILWIQRMGGATLPKEEYFGKAEFPEFPGAESIEAWRFRGGGPAMFAMLAENVAKRDKIQVTYSARAKRLVMSRDGQVIGVVAENDGREIALKARRAVILTCGGFEWNEEMKLDYLRGYPVHFYCNPGNTGDGIRMAQKAGAALWHMNSISARVIPKFAEFEPGMWGGTPNGFILVDRYGKRFAKERPWVSHSFWLEVCHFDTMHSEYPRIPCMSIFDDTALKLGPPAWSSPKGKLPDGTVQRFYEWSKDSVEEIRRGWVLKGNSIEELAAVIAAGEENQGRMTGAVLKSTIDEYNQFCSGGEDKTFGRDPRTMLPIQTPPFYAIKMYPGGPNTQGGPKRNAQSQVVDPMGNPIQRLYAAGELGSIYAMLYPAGGGNVAEYVAFGRIAGENAASEERWS